jgi:hypothetical protein
MRRSTAGWTKVEFVTEPAFGLHIPVSCPDVPAEILNPRNAWADKEAYDRTAADLAARFEANFQQFDSDRGVRESHLSGRLRTEVRHGEDAPRHGQAQKFDIGGHIVALFVAIHRDRVPRSMPRMPEAIKTPRQERPPDIRLRNVR